MKPVRWQLLLQMLRAKGISTVDIERRLGLKEKSLGPLSAGWVKDTKHLVGVQLLQLAEEHLEPRKYRRLLYDTPLAIAEVDGPLPGCGPHGQDEPNGCAGDSAA